MARWRTSFVVVWTIGIPMVGGDCKTFDQIRKLAGVLISIIERDLHGMLRGTLGLTMGFCLDISSRGTPFV